MDAIVEWLKGTGLIPFLKPLSADEQAAYLAAYRDELAKAYKPLADGTVILPFRASSLSRRAEVVYNF